MNPLGKAKRPKREYLNPFDKIPMFFEIQFEPLGPLRRHDFPKGFKPRLPTRARARERSAQGTATMLKTLCTLSPGTKADGTRCVKGELSRSITTTDHKGGQRHYPPGTPIMLVRNAKAGSYSLLATIEDPAADLQNEIDCITEDERATACPF
jgi:hypothetical protein